MLWYVQYYTCIISDITVTSYTARTSSPETDTVKKAGVTSPSPHTDVEMTHNPAYGPIATLKGEAQYEEVASWLSLHGGSCNQPYACLLVRWLACYS